MLVYFLNFAICPGADTTAKHSAKAWSVEQLIGFSKGFELMGSGRQGNLLGLFLIKFSHYHFRVIVALDAPT